jgi:chitinase
MSKLVLRRLTVGIVALFGATRCGGSGAASDGATVQRWDGGTPFENDAAPASDSAAASDGTSGGDDAATGDSASSDSGASSDDGQTAADGAPAPSAKLVGGYYPNWTPSPVRIRDVDPHYNLIYLFAATPTGGSPGNGEITWTPPGDGLGAATNLNADIAYARQTQGRKIILSIGGADNDMSFPDRTTSQTFVSSVASVYAALGGFDGIDWDTYEGTDSPDTSEMIWISQQLKSMFPGFLITSPPAPWSTVDQTFCSQMEQASALDWCAPQYYDGPNLATQAYIVPSVDTWSSLLGETSLVVGFGIAEATNYMTVAEVISTWDQVNTNHPNLRGAFDWQIDVDQSTGWPFATQVGPLINP